MKSARLGRRRHLRRSNFNRYRVDPSGTYRSVAVGYWDRIAANLAATGGDQVFTTTFATDTLNIAAHGHATGDGPFSVTSGTTLPDGLVAGVLYWVINLTAGTMQLAFSRAEAFAAIVVPLADDGTGTHTLTPSETNNGMFEHNRRHVRPEILEAATGVDDLV